LFTSICIMKILWTAVTLYTANLALADKKLVETIGGALSFQGVILGWVFFFLRRERLSWNAAFGIRRSTFFRAAGLGLIVGIVVVPLAWVLQYFCVRILERLSLGTEPQQLVKTMQEAQTLGGPSVVMEQIVFGFSVILFAPIAEELLFRGVIYTTFKQLGYPRLALWSTSILFAAFHNNLPSILPLIFLALTLVAVYERTDNLLAPIVTHSVFNTANFIYLIYEKPINKFFTPG
jgi:membrane protease YdiL (CAAX protease family)